MALERAMSRVKVGPKGQIVISKEIRDMFDIKPGDGIVILADKNRGVCFIKEQEFLDKYEKNIQQ